MFCESNFPSTKFLYLVALFCTLLKSSISEKCIYKNNCECVFQNGSVIDLTSLGYHNSYRWGDLKSKNPNETSFRYYYNPCFGFSLGDTACSKEVAVCQVDTRNTTYNNLGSADSAYFILEKSIVKLMYSAHESSTYVSLICDEKATTPELTVIGETGQMHYDMTLTTRCACPDLCRTSHLSTGSVLVIIFMIFVSLYLILGIVHSSLTRGAHGWELIPHYEFWADFPLLVRDGCVFVVNGCKPETAYERI